MYYINTNYERKYSDNRSLMNGTQTVVTQMNIVKKYPLSVHHECCEIFTTISPDKPRLLGNSGPD